MNLETTQVNAPNPSEQANDFVVPPGRQDGDSTPYNAYVAFPGQVRRGPAEALPPRWQHVGHALRNDLDHPVVEVHVRDATFYRPSGIRLSEAACKVVRVLWETGRVGKPRVVLNALLPEFPQLAEATLGLIVVRVPVCGGRTMGVGFVRDPTLQADCLWDKTGRTSDRMHAFLMRRYGGQMAREEATVVHQRRFRERESEIPTPTTRGEATRLALERALGKSLREAIPCWRLPLAVWEPGNLLATLHPELRTIVEVNLDLIWDLDTDTALDFDPMHLHRCLIGYNE